MNIVAMSDESLRAETTYRTQQIRDAARPWAWQLRRRVAGQRSARRASDRGSERQTLLRGSGAWLAAR